MDGRLRRALREGKPRERDLRSRRLCLGCGKEPVVGDMMNLVARGSLYQVQVDEDWLVPEELWFCKPCRNVRRARAAALSRSWQAIRTERQQNERERTTTYRFSWTIHLELSVEVVVSRVASREASYAHLYAFDKARDDLYTMALRLTEGRLLYDLL